MTRQERNEWSYRRQAPRGQNPPNHSTTPQKQTITIYNSNKYLNGSEHRNENGAENPAKPETPPRKKNSQNQTETKTAAGDGEEDEAKREKAPNKDGISTTLANPPPKVLETVNEQNTPGDGDEHSDEIKEPDHSKAPGKHPLAQATGA